MSCLRLLVAILWFWAKELREVFGHICHGCDVFVALNQIKLVNSTSRWHCKMLFAVKKYSSLQSNIPSLESYNAIHCRISFLEKQSKIHWIISVWILSSRFANMIEWHMTDHVIYHNNSSQFTWLFPSLACLFFSSLTQTYEVISVHRSKCYLDWDFLFFKDDSEIYQIWPCITLKNLFFSRNVCKMYNWILYIGFVLLLSTPGGPSKKIYILQFDLHKFHTCICERLEVQK